MFLLPDGTFWVQLINFAIFFVILDLVFVRPVQKAIAGRRAYIDGLTADYDRAQAEATELRRRAEETRMQARREADQIVSRARAEMSNEAAEIGADFNKLVQTEIEQAHATVASELESMRPRMQTLAKELGDQIVAGALEGVQ